MHALGMKVELGGVTVSQYQANRHVPERLLRTYVSALDSIGDTCFLGVWPVIQDIEKESGLNLLPAMMGLEHHVDKPADNGETSFSGAVPMIPDTAEKELSLDSDKDPDNSANKPLRRVGYTIDMSINLWNSSQYDVHNASQGFSIWTEEVRGRGHNWFFVMPNLFGRRPDGSTFSGIAVKLS
jgi:hypothetical protein